MTRLWDRRLPRISYGAPAVVVDVGSNDRLDVRVVNLSEGGAHLSGERPLPVASQLLCRLPVGNEYRQLRGRVVWSREPTTGHGSGDMGIEFLDLGPEEARDLRSLVGSRSSGALSSEFWVAGINEPIPARAQITADGILLTTSLPFLHKKGPIEFSFIEDRSRRYRGLITNISLRSQPDLPSPTLQLDVELKAKVPTQARGSTPPPVEASPPEPRRRRPGNTQVVAPLRYRRPRLQNILTIAATTAAAVLLLVAGLLALTHRRETPAQPAASADEPMTPRPETTAPDARDERAPAVAGTGDEAMMAEPPAPSGPVPTATPPQPQVVVDDTRAVITIPFAGSAEDLDEYLLADPPGIAINLPHAEPADSTHWIRAAGIKVLWLRERQGGLHVRVVFMRSALTYELRTEDEKLLLTIERPARH